LAFSFQLAKGAIELLLQEGLVAPQFLDQLLMYRGM
jgi:hypothetical protein